MIWPLANAAGAVPGLATVVVHTHVLPRAVAPPTLSGSTAHDPPERGFTNDPVAGGVAETVTLKAPVADARTTVPPAAVHVRVSLPAPVSEQAMVPVPRIPVEPDTDGVP